MSWVLVVCFHAAFAAGGPCDEVSHPSFYQCIKQLEILKAEERVRTAYCKPEETE